MVTDEAGAVEDLAVFVADAVGRADGDDIAHGVSLHGPAPARGGVETAVMGLRPDGGGVEQHLRAHQRHGARRFRKPLVPANAHADAAERGIPDLEAGIAGAEIVLLLIARPVGDMALAVDAQRLAARVQHDQRIIIARPLALEDGDRDGDIELGGEGLHRDDARMLHGRPGVGEPALFLAGAEIMGLEQFGRQDDLRAASGGLAHEFRDGLDVLVHVEAEGALQDGDMNRVAHGRADIPCEKLAAMGARLARARSGVIPGGRLRRPPEEPPAISPDGGGIARAGRPEAGCRDRGARLRHRRRRRRHSGPSAPARWRY